MHQVGHKYLEDSHWQQFGWWTVWSTRKHWSSHWNWLIQRDASIRQKDSSWQLALLQETVLGWTLSRRTPATTTQHDPQPIFLLRWDNSMENNLNRPREVEPVEPSSKSTEQQVCKQHVITHTTQQDDGGSVVRLLSKMDPKQLGTCRLAA